ncbi:MAG: extracellular solute-binding protein [Ruminococcaceae bacterium]|nr:extracellular solute-binding protein [Oscillospiraceae bacterium]
MKRKKGPGTIAISLLLAVLILSGCGTAGKDKGSSGDNKTDSEYTYIAEYIKVGGEAEGIIKNMKSLTAAHDGKVYLVATEITELEQNGNAEKGEQNNPTSSNEGGEKLNADTPASDEGPGPEGEMPGYMGSAVMHNDYLISVNEDGTNVKKLPEYKAPEFKDAPEGAVIGNTILSINTEKDGNILIAEKLEIMNSFELISGSAEVKDQNTEQVYLRRLSPEGKEINKIGLETIVGEGKGYYDFKIKIAPTGELVILAGETQIFVLAADFSVKGKMSLPEEKGWVQNIVSMADGSIALAYTDFKQGERVLKPVDVQKGELKADIALPREAFDVRDGAMGYDVLISGQNTVTGYNTKEAKSEEIINWVSADIMGEDVAFMHFRSDDKVLIGLFPSEQNAMSRRERTGNIEFAILNRVKKTELSAKTELSLAAIYLDSAVRAEVVKFNKQSDKYRIVVKDYSEYNTDTDYNAGQLKLISEITAGNVPDIIQLNNMPTESLVKSGALTDLMPLLSADKELGGTDAIFKPVFDILKSRDGSLRTIAFSFNVMSALALNKSLDGKTSVNIEEAKEMLKKLPEGAELMGQGFTKENALGMQLYLGASKLIDREKGTCNFNSPDFIGMLEFANMFPETFDWNNVDNSEYAAPEEKLMSGKQLFMEFFLDEANFNAFRKIYAVLNGEVTVTGFPGGTASGGALGLYGNMAISDSCRDKEGAWQFVRRFLTPEFQNNMMFGLPVNSKVFDAKVKQAMSPKYEDDPDSPGGKKEVPHMLAYVGAKQDQVVKVFQMSEKELEMIMNLIKTAAPIAAYDQQLMEIVKEESAAFFSGDKTAAQVAETIQNRASTYISEKG